MRILDRYIVKAFLVNYLLALGVMVGMYTLLDLIVNFENFAKGAAVPGAAQANATAFSILADMADYYGYQMLVIFQQVSGAIPLLAAGFTMVRMTRHHELTAMLASGVSLYRVATPIIGVSMLFSVINVVMQEFVVSQPTVIEKLLRKHDQVNQTVTRKDPIYHVVDRDNSLLSAREYIPGKKAADNITWVTAPQLNEVFIVARDREGVPIRHTTADTATWEVPANQTMSAWVLRNVVTEDDGQLVNPQQRVAMVVPTLPYFTSITPEQLDLIFQKKAVDFLSSAQVNRLIEFSAPSNKLMLEKMMHLRFTQPLMNIVMLLIGIPFLLTREPTRLVINMFYCVAVSGVVFISTFVIFQMAGNQIPHPLLAAWLPVLIFGPFALVMMDLIQT